MPVEGEMACLGYVGNKLAQSFIHSLFFGAERKFDIDNAISMSGN